MANYLGSAGVQSFSITIASIATSGTATINAVGSGAFILYDGVNAAATTNPAQGYANLTLTNSTTITASRTLTGGPLTVSGVIVDASSSLVNSVQYGAITIASGSASNTATITAVTNANTALHSLGFATTSPSLAPNAIYPVLTLSGTTVTATLPANASGGNIIVRFVVIEFQGAVLNQSVQNISATSSAAVTSWTAAVTSVNTSNTICIFGGSSIGQSSTSPQVVKMAGTLTSSTLFTVNANTASFTAVPKIYNASIVEFISGVLNSAVQRSTTTLTGVTSNTSTLGTSVTTANTALSSLGNTASVSSNNIDESEALVKLTNSTTLTSTKNTSTGNTTASWEVVEFVPSTGNVGSATGVATVSGVGVANKISVGSATGVATVSGISSTGLNSVGSATGVATASGVSNALAQSVGSSIGVATVTGQSPTIVSGAGSAIGVATVAGVGFAAFFSVGSATGVAIVNAAGLKGIASTGSTTGTAAVTGIGAQTNASVGSSTGVATVSGVGITAKSSIGSSTGTAVVNGVSRALLASVGSAIGVATVSGVTNALAASVGSAIGVATVTGKAPIPVEILTLLEFMSNQPVYSTGLITAPEVDAIGMIDDELTLIEFLTNNPVYSKGLMTNSPVTLLGSFL